MTSTREKIRQLAPHWAVMFVLMFALIAVAEAITGSLTFWQSFVVIVATTFAYPTTVRYLGFAPAVWQRN